MEKTEMERIERLEKFVNDVEYSKVKKMIAEKKKENITKKLSEKDLLIEIHNRINEMVIDTPNNDLIKIKSFADNLVEETR